jgi:hypothetical protein
MYMLSDKEWKHYPFRWNLTYAYAYAKILWEENTVGSLKTTADLAGQPVL